jgi:hypothetical protein
MKEWIQLFVPITEQDRHCTYNITLWRVTVTIVAMEMQKCSLFIVFGIDAAFNQIKAFIVVMKSNNGFPLHCCQATKYFLLLVIIIISVKYYECVFVFLP